MTIKVLITGASGFLGRAILDVFTADGLDIEITPLAFSNRDPKFVLLDLQDSAAVSDYFSRTWKGSSGDWVIHCAAERRPDVAEKNPEAAQRLNAEVPGHLAELSKQHGFTLVYISTDYVFDGTNPPYKPDATPNPLQLYGRTKLAGEKAVLSVEGAKSVILRVPVLYGPTSNPSDSAINILLDVVKDQSGKLYKMDHYAVRYPTNVVDIGRFLLRLCEMSPKDLPKLLHFSAPEPYTKYEIVLLLASIIGVSHKHISPDEDDPTLKPGAVTRPRDCKLDTTETEVLLDGIPGGVLGCVGFEEWWRQELGGKA